MSDGGKGKETFPDLKEQTRDTVASKLGIGSGKQYEKEKFISDNRSTLTPEDFADWDEGKLSTNKAYFLFFGRPLITIGFIGFVRYYIAYFRLYLAYWL